MTIYNNLIIKNSTTLSFHPFECDSQIALVATDFILECSLS